MHQEGAHFKGYASETIQIVKVLHAFFLAKDVHRRLPAIGRVVEIMDSTLNIFRKGGAAVHRATDVADLFMELHVLTLENFTAEVVKIKTHFCHHLGPQLTSFNTSTSCFSNERRNQILKRVCSRVHHTREPYRHATARWLAELLAHYKTTSGIEFRVRALSKAMDMSGSVELSNALAELWGSAPTATKVFKTIACESGTLRAGMLLKVRGLFGDGFLCIDFFVEATFSFSEKRFAALGVQMARSGPNKPDFKKVSAFRQHLVCITEIECCVPYFDNGSGGYVPLPQ